MATASKAKRTYSFQQKEQILREHVDQGLSISAISRKHQINVVTLYNWKKMLMTSKPPKDTDLTPEEIANLLRENEALKKAVADLAIDKAILKEANAILIKKKQLPPPAWLRQPKK
jgi:transposase-like protein